MTASPRACDLPSSQTGSSDSYTRPSAPKTRNRSKLRANQRSWVTATTVPSNLAKPSSSASAECRSRLSVGSSSSSRVAPDSSRRRIWKRACWPPESDSNRCSLEQASPYRSSARAASSRGLPARCSSPRWRISSRVRPRSDGCSCVWANQPGRTREPAVPRPCARPATGGRPPRAGAPAPGRCRHSRAAGGSATCPTRSSRGRRRARVPDLEVEGFISPVSSRSFATIARLAVRPPVRRILTFWCTGIASGGPARRTSPSGSGRPGTADHPVVVRRLDLEGLHQGLELEVLLVPAPPQLLEPGARSSRAWAYVAEMPRVHPERRAHGTRLEGGDARGDAVEQLAIMADEQHRLGRRDERVTPGASSARRGSCPARRAAAPPGHAAGLEDEPLLLTAGERRDLAPSGPSRRGRRGPRRCTGPRSSPARSRPPRPTRRGAWA